MDESSARKAAQDTQSAARPHAGGAAHEQDGRARPVFAFSSCGPERLRPVVAARLISLWHCGKKTGRIAGLLSPMMRMMRKIPALRAHTTLSGAIQRCLTPATMWGALLFLLFPAGLATVQVMENSAQSDAHATAMTIAGAAIRHQFEKRAASGAQGQFEKRAAPGAQGQFEQRATPGAQAQLILEQAVRITTGDLAVPDDIQGSGQTGPAPGWQPEWQIVLVDGQGHLIASVPRIPGLSASGSGPRSGLPALAIPQDQGHGAASVMLDGDQFLARFFPLRSPLHPRPSVSEASADPGPDPEQARSPDGAPPHHFVPDGAAPHHFLPDGAAPHHFLPDGAAPHHFVPDGAPPSYSVVVMMPVRSFLPDNFLNFVPIIVFVLCCVSIAAIMLVQYWELIQKNRAEQNHQCARARIDAALERGRCGIFDWNLARDRLYLSPSFRGLLDLGDTDIIGFDSFAALVCEEDIDLYALRARLLSSQQDTIDVVFRLRHTAGHQVWLRARGELRFESPDGAPDAAAGAHLIGTCSDVSEQQRAAQQTRRADERLRAALNTISEAFVLWDEDGRPVLCNNKFRSLHEAAHAQAGTAVVPDIAGLARPGVARASSSAQFVIGGRWWQMSEQRMRDGGLVCVGTDITDLKMQQEAEAESARKLNGIISDLKAARIKSDRQARDMEELAQRYATEKNRAEQASEAKSAFLANMSHELRTPLNAIIGFADIMNNQLFGPLSPPRYAEYCQDIHKSGQYLLHVINDILDMERIESGRVVLRPEPVVLRGVIDEAVRLTTPDTREKNMSCAVECSADLAIEGDRRAIKQIILNIVINAVKFTGAGGQVTISARRVASAGPPAICISIRDNGIGIAARDIAQLARPFVQLENQMTKTRQGSGLGLAIARSLVELHNGVMAIDSHEGVGTSVNLFFPETHGESIKLPVEAAPAA